MVQRRRKEGVAAIAGFPGSCPVDSKPNLPVLRFSPVCFPLLVSGLACRRRPAHTRQKGENSDEQTYEPPARANFLEYWLHRMVGRSGRRLALGSS